MVDNKGVTFLVRDSKGADVSRRGCLLTIVDNYTEGIIES